MPVSTTSPTHSCGITDGEISQADSTPYVGDSFRASLIMNYTNHLKNETKDLHIAFLQHQSNQTSTVPSTYYDRFISSSEC